MKKFNAKEILIPTVSLFLICAVVTLLLAVANSVTKPKIAELRVETENKTKAAVLETAEKFSDSLTVTKDGKEYAYYEGYDNNDNLMGYVFTTVAKGYGGDITVMVGVDADGSVTGIEYLSISETAGLGMNAQKDSFKEQFKGKKNEIAVSKNAPSDTEIQALTGATITSKAVTSAVNDALSLYEEVAK